MIKAIAAMTLWGYLVVGIMVAVWAAFATNFWFGIVLLPLAAAMLVVFLDSLRGAD